VSVAYRSLDCVLHGCTLLDDFAEMTAEQWDGLLKGALVSSIDVQHAGNLVIVNGQSYSSTALIGSMGIELLRLRKDLVALKLLEQLLGVAESFLKMMEDKDGTIDLRIMEQQCFDAVQDAKRLGLR
jgi:hypothetical protein